MTDSATTPQTTSRSVQLVQEAGGVKEYLSQLGNELKEYYQQQIDTEEDAVKRIPLHNDMVRINSLIDLSR